jgi:integrase
MARAIEKMSWEGPPNFRWYKMHKGVRYRVTCADLKSPVWTKQATVKLANEWWEKTLQGLLTAESVAPGALAAAANAIPADVSQQPVQEPLVRDEYIQRAPAPVPKPDPIQGHLDAFLAIERAKAKTASTYGDLALYLKKFAEGITLKGKPGTPARLVFSGDMDVHKIDESTVRDFYLWLRNSSYVGQRKLWGYFRRFVRDLAMNRVIPMPLNLDARIFSFEVTAKEIKTYPTETVRTMVAGLPDRLKLYALLALNCGMYPVDMATLQHSEWKDGRIIRKRTKTRKQNGVPTVSYKLWPETQALLEQYAKGDHPEYVLTSLTGSCLWTRHINERGKEVKKNLITMQWKRGRGEGRATFLPIPIKALRSVGATLLESHETYARYVQMYLGHSPRSIAERHYAAPSREGFDQAVNWLREQVLGNK